MRRLSSAAGAFFVGAWLTREESLFLLGLAITVLQIIYDYYKNNKKS